MADKREIYNMKSHKLLSSSSNRQGALVAGMKSDCFRNWTGGEIENKK